jgi:hypothetical protein
MRRYELSLSNGFASYFGVGKTELLTMKTNILPRSPGVVLLWLSSMSPLPGNAYEHFCGYKVWKGCGGRSKKFNNFLDSLTQMSCENAYLRILWRRACIATPPGATVRSDLP